MSETNQYYPEKDAQELGQHYLNHVSAMTVEKLHSKSDIAIQLAWRDQEIESLQAELEQVKGKLDYWYEEAGRLDTNVRFQVEQKEKLQAELEKVKGELVDLIGIHSYKVNEAKKLEAENAELKEKYRKTFDELIDDKFNHAYEIKDLKQKLEEAQGELSFINAQYVEEEDKNLTMDAQLLKYKAKLKASEKRGKELEVKVAHFEINSNLSKIKFKGK